MNESSVIGFNTLGDKIKNVFLIFFLAICSKACQNSGECVAPDTCSCPPYFTGPQCATGR